MHTDSASTAYEERSQAFLKVRDASEIGSGVVARWSSCLERGAAGIELACGAGHPITRTLDRAGFRLWAVDSSPSLLSVFNERFSHIPAQCCKVQDFDFYGRRFDFAVAVGLVFLLPENEQKQLVSRMAAALVPGGRCLISAPLEAGFWRDRITGVECHSLGQARYTQLFLKSGFRVLATHEDRGQSNYFDLQLTSD